MTSLQSCSDSFHPENPIKAFDTLAGSHTPFFAYRLPGQESINLGKGTLIDISDYDGSKPVFVIAPFDPNRQAKAIVPEVSFQTPCISPSQMPHIKVKGTPKPTSRYVNAIAELTRKLSSRGGKTVIARAVEADGEVESLGAMFHALCQSYPLAYVYCWHLGHGRFWLGAVPELLLKSYGSSVVSMALAGTMEATSDQPWNRKNLEEQKLVTDFIANIFSQNGMTPTTDGPYDKPAGPVKHLCTLINAKKPSDDFDILKFAYHLSPTPAVSGFPREEALKDIVAIENIDREYYGGYSGPVTNRKQGMLFVTLRCMTIDTLTGHIRLYAGGGITPLSDPVEEWRETCLKASTLLSIFS